MQASRDLQSNARASQYRGRLAPSPTGLLHLGHARTFWIAQERARAHGGVLILRNEDLDSQRSKPEFVSAMIEDLQWFGFEWTEGPDVGGPFAPYSQSERINLYRSAFNRLRAGGFVYPCTCSRQDVLRALSAPHQGEEEPVYPGTCRLNNPQHVPQGAGGNLQSTSDSRINWRFRVPDGETIRFVDGGCGPQEFVAGKHFGDFVVWRHDDVSSYQLAVVVDDAAMGITEVVRGEDLLLSTARQLLLYRALAIDAPAFFHCELMTDEQGIRLAKRHDSLSLRTLRAAGGKPNELRAEWKRLMPRWNKPRHEATM
ncbi:MAG: tRNA glutamyl-Q(34) synthetase GluQRS [Verrucomicrobia bacterium]|nr:tRNA glutamyl-Q(34) synthetase GluQRS [Verrucomicrobiota bacterium]